VAKGDDGDWDWVMLGMIENRGAVGSASASVDEDEVAGRRSNSGRGVRGRCKNGKTIRMQLGLLRLKG